MFIKTLEIIVVLAAIIAILWAVHRIDELDDLEAELTAQSLALDERANRIAAEQETLKQEWEYLQQASELMRKTPSGDGGENPQ